MKRNVFLALGVAASVALVLTFQVGTASGDSSDIGISNIQSSFDGFNCEVTITWDTAECTTTNQVHWGNASCQNPNYIYTENTSTGAGRSHSATFSVLDATGPKIAFQVESSNSCDSQASNCTVSKSRPCIQ